jgi:regulatory protein
MTIVSITPGTGAELERIELSDGSLFSFKVCYLPPVFPEGSLFAGFADFSDFAGREISGDEEEGFRFAARCLRAEKKALRLTARAEQSVFGLSRKLERAGFDGPCVRAVLARLCELDIVNDGRFAELWLSSRIAMKADGPRHLLAGLRGRGIDRDDAESALKKLLLDTETEAALLERFITKRKLSGTPGLSGLLRAEGFSGTAVRRYVEEGGL